MKTKIIMSITIISVVALFAIVRVAVGHEMDREAQTDYARSDNYHQRMDAEWEMMQSAITDSKGIRRNLETDPKDKKECVRAVRESLEYALDHFDELKKGKNADIDVISKLSYAYSYIYYSVLYSDYDQTVYTMKERKLAKCLVSEYTDIAKRYMSSTASNTQEKADLLKAQRLARQLSKNLDEEVEVFVDRLVDVIEEGKK